MRIINTFIKLAAMDNNLYKFDTYIKEYLQYCWVKLAHEEYFMFISHY